MAFQPHDKLWNRSFTGMLIAQFQAAFSDQAIQASAMFYAIRMETMPAWMAIALLPVLFYSPWAIFVTWAGYLSDKFSKQFTIRFWKVFEVGIVMLTFTGFFLGSIVGQQAEWARYAGSYLVMATVFLMGMQSAFFVPAKYGIMPEIFQHHLLSRGNGILESLSFLAIILGTVAGGVLIYVFGPDVLPNHEPWLGVILIVLSLGGAACSFMVERIPAAHPQREFPYNPFKPILRNLGTLVRSRPLRFAIMGIAFFTFIVAFMRNTMYMHGQSRIPEWTELHTSLVVGAVAFGIGLGSPLAGWLSGGKIELGLVPLGALGMFFALLVAAVVLNVESALVVCVIASGFFTGFYIVPMYTLLQHRAPKESKGDMIATSNFINVIGAIIATVLFAGIWHVSTWTNIIFEVPTKKVAQGELLDVEFGPDNKIKDFKIRLETDGIYHFDKDKPTQPASVDDRAVDRKGHIRPPEDDKPGTEVVVIHYIMWHSGEMPWHKGQYVEHFKILPVELSTTIYNQERLPRYLFLGAGVITLLILVLLWQQLPDLFARCMLWLRSHGRYHLKVVGIQNLPSEGPAILATNCDTHETALQVVAVTDRSINFLLLANPEEKPPGPLLRYITQNTETISLPLDGNGKEWIKAILRSEELLEQESLVGLTVDLSIKPEAGARLLEEVRRISSAPILPVYCGDLKGGGDHVHEPLRNVRVVIGHPVNPDATIDEIRQRIRLLGDWIHQTESEGAIATTAMIPGPSGAMPIEKQPEPPVE